jgi:2-C-methyl-D-erythritol 4-phosphate cytidylyltransferase
MILIMPMAGLGSRFGGDTPKPRIPVDGVPMFVAAERSIGLDFAERIFIVRQEHQLTEVIEQYRLFN